MKEILIITHSKDNASIEMVTKSLEAKGAKAIRLNTDFFPLKSNLEATYGEGQQSLFYVDEHGVRHDLNNLEAVWYRRSRLSTGINEVMEAKYLRPTVKEVQRSFWGIMASLEVFTFDPYHTIKTADEKPLQLKIAQSLGLNIPKSLVCNSPDAVKVFKETCPNGIVTKMMSSFAIYEDGKENVVYTNELSDEDIADMEGLQLCPMTFQEKIEKKVELRITIVGDKIFTAAIDSQVSEKAKLDWRRDGHDMIEDWVPYELPDEIGQKLLKLMDELRLNYGAIDMIVTPENKYVFLEINPVGEFFWLQIYSDLSISEAIAEVLLGERMRRI